MRKLASVVVIDNIVKHSNADSLELAIVGGWQVAVKKGEFSIGQKVVFFEIDSWVPSDIAPFLSKGRTYRGVLGEKLRTIKLRGELSQGLILSLEQCFLSCTEVNVGEDVSEILNIQKWEPPVPAQLSGMARGLFVPGWKRTDQERVQNLEKEIQDAYDNDVKFEVTLKLDGSSMSIGLSPEKEYSVCSRNINLKLDQKGNTFINMSKELAIQEHLEMLGLPIQISGELMGPGIQGNREILDSHQFYVFDIYNPVTQEYMSPCERHKMTNYLMLDHVPIIAVDKTLKELGLHNIGDILKYADRPSIKHNIAEGVVFKSMDGTFSFKSINNKFLLRQM